jgi:hypothetical protein
VTDATAPEDTSGLSDLSFLLLLGCLSILLCRALTPADDPLDDLRQRVATLEGKVSS